MAASRLYARDTVDDIKGVPNTLSSWDNCMSKNYCKWPAIIAIIIAAVVILSIVWCLVRCMCCGLSCCCDCFSCCTSCCRGSGRGRHRHLDNEAPPAAAGGYGGGYRPPPQPMGYETPRYAQFDVPHKAGAPVNDDALPPMPSWDNAPQHRQKGGDDMEMGELDATTSQKMPMLGDVGMAHRAGASSPGMAYHDNDPNMRGNNNGYGYGGASSPPGGAPQPSPHWQNGGAGAYNAHDTSYNGAAGYPQAGLGYSGQEQHHAPSAPAPVTSYSAYSPYHQQPPQELGVARGPSGSGHNTPTALTPGRPQQDSWTVV
ncbi:MAG: hypothetical protein M4579_002252 [Chaenotheca gracillima]|nr:MAG: hypothetical protein M4579_002252 [Chaenotheca gracillima]